MKLMYARRLAKKLGIINFVVSVLTLFVRSIYSVFQDGYSNLFQSSIIMLSIITMM